jgi:hypothetical protein
LRLSIHYFHFRRRYAAADYASLLLIFIAADAFIFRRLRDVAFRAMPRQLILRHAAISRFAPHYAIIATPYFAIAILFTFFFLRRHCRYAIRHAATPPRRFRRHYFFRLPTPLFSLFRCHYADYYAITLCHYFICQPLLSPLLFRHSLSFSSFRHFASIERFAG